MESLDLLEKRIDALTRMLGPIGDEIATGGVSDPNQTENIVDSLLSANALLNEATSEREVVNKSMQRAPELEKYLDPSFLDEHQQVRAKEVYLNAVAPDLHGQCEQLERIKQLEPTLGAEYFRNIPGECVDKLKQVSIDNGQFTEQCETIENTLIAATKRYGEIQMGLQKSLDDMTKRIELIQEKMEQNKRAELEKELETKQA